MAPQAVCILGMGAQTPVGRSAASSAAAVRAGISRYCSHPEWLDREGDPITLCLAGWLDDTLTGTPRLVALAEDAALEALLPLGPRTDRPIDLILAFPEPRPGLDADAAEALVEALSARLKPIAPLGDISIVVQGHAAGAIAMEQARARIEAQPDRLCLVGGVDSYYHRDTLHWLEERQWLRSIDNRWGFTPGEGAAFCLLGSEEAATSRSLSPCIQVTSTGQATEPSIGRTDQVNLGRGLTAAFARALRPMRPCCDVVGTLIGDLNGEIHRAEELGFAMTRVSERFVAPERFTAPADCWGDQGASSIFLFASLALAGWSRGYARGDHAMVWAGSFGGQRGAMVLSHRSESA